MAPGLVLTLQEGAHAGSRHLAADDPATEREDVGVVVLASQAGGDGIGRLDAADAAHLVGHDRLAGPAAPEHDPQLELAARTARATGAMKSG